MILTLKSFLLQDFPEYLINLGKSKEEHLNVNYNFLVKLYSELNNDQKLKFSKNLQPYTTSILKTG